MPTLEERVTRLEQRMDELTGCQTRSEQDVAKPSSEHMATLNRHTAMHRENGVVLARLTLDVHKLKTGMEQIIGMLDTLIEQGRER